MIMRCLWALALCGFGALMCLGKGAAAQEPPAVTNHTDALSHTVTNGRFTLRYEINNGRLRIEKDGQPIAPSVDFCEELNGTAPRVSYVEQPLSPLGALQGLELAAADGKCTQAFYLAPDVPFILTRVTLANRGPEEILRKTLKTFSAPIDMGVDLKPLRWMGCDGLAPVENGKTSYVFLALAAPQTRAGLVAGWITHERASGIVTGAFENGSVRLSARAEYGRVPIAPGSLLESEYFAIGLFEDVLDGLDAFAALTAKMNRIELKKDIPCGYCTWYHAGALNEKGMASLARFCAEQRLNEFGMTTLQIDDGWQILSRDFTTHKPDGPYPNGMKATADVIAQAGFHPGLWLIPFGWDAKSPTFTNHQDYFTRRADGAIYDVTWAGDCLDMTHPEARALLIDTVRRAVREWGYSYLKIDGLWTGIAAKILYPSPEYRDDGLGDAVFHDKSKTNIDAFRMGLRAVREAAGPDAYILGCCIPQNMRSMGGAIGLVDGMRIGADISAEWKSIITCVPMAARLYFWNGKVWYNDPDCLLVRKPLTLDQARAWGSLIALSGQMNMDSDWIPGLPPDRLDILKRTMPNTGYVARPLDLFQQNMPACWHLRCGEGAARRDVIGLFRWEQAQPDTAQLDLARLGLPQEQDAAYIGFDYWENQFLTAFHGACPIELRPDSCRVIALQKASHQPQLLSTSRHVAQLLQEVKNLQWDADRKCLRGVSHVIAADPYELRIHCGTFGMNAAAVSPDDLAAGVAVTTKNEKPFLRVKLASPKSRDIAWQVTFTE